jgi:hypothetical protein
MGISYVSIWGSPYGNDDPHMENIPIRGFFSSIPKWAQALFENGLVTEPVPIWKQGLLASMKHVQHNGKFAKKIIFFHKKIGFFQQENQCFWQENQIF